MSAQTDFEDRMADLLAARTTGDGDRWPIVGYVVYIASVDPETMRAESGDFITPEGQSAFMTRGLIEAARDELTADTLASVSYGEWDEDDE